MGWQKEVRQSQFRQTGHQSPSQLYRLLAWNLANRTQSNQYSTHFAQLLMNLIADSRLPIQIVAAHKRLRQPFFLFHSLWREYRMQTSGHRLHLRQDFLSARLQKLCQRNKCYLNLQWIYPVPMDTAASTCGS